MTTGTTIDRPDWLSATAWPWPTRAVPTAGGRVAVTDVGRGPVMVFVHTGAWSFVWRDLLSALSPTFRCITLDAPGCGLSDRVPGDRVSLQGSADAVTAVLEQLDLTEVTLVAHDLGGPAALAAAAAGPDRIAAIVAVNCFGWRPTGMAFRGMLAVMGSAPLRASDAALGWLPRATSGRFGVGRHWPTGDRAVFRAGIDRRARRSWHRYFADARSADRIYRKIDTALAGPLADRPLLTVFGQHNDPLRFQPRWKQRFPKARQEVVPGANHFPMCDDPQRVANLLRSWHRTIAG
ncbi:alpha/beta fold hydrolase [Rhodococcus sp. JS3073]|uniref:alpha/beta fold hydrolase n=1 Tax=Rhodococcus sp. JS3073 TaxID=3002901 RepID=UPI002286BA10|nr:alpha/beta fold hydrolase [Rhodococcus sp. JS3073]WAM19457.1 alpha/beta fold hydrolase [Rhodococcus sp. JS3073]